MKKSNKVIALILAMMLAFSSLPLIASASAIKDEVKTVESLIQPESLADLVNWLLASINNRKEEITGTVLRLVFMFMDDESLKAKIGETDLMTATDEQLAKILVDWLNANLPEWTKDLPQDILDTVKVLTLGRISINLKTVDGVVSSLYSLANTNLFGDISDLKEDALKNVSVSKSGNLGVVHALLQFLADNPQFFQKTLKGQLNLGGLNDIVKSFFDINAEIKKYISPEAIRKMLIDAVELDYETYKNYSADEIVAVAFLQLLTGAETVSQNDAKAVMELSIYGFLNKYAKDIYTNLLLGPLNNDVRTLLVENVKPLDDAYNNILDEVFNWDYVFEANTFNEFFTLEQGNLVEQLNNAVIALLKVILTDKAFADLNLTKGGNENIEENLAKAFRYILPKLGQLDLGGVSLAAFTTETVKNMSAEEMAVGVLKLFFPGWFKLDAAKIAETNKAKTLEQLAVLAAKYAVTNKEWVPMDIKAASMAANVDTLADDACLDIVFEIGMETAAKALKYNASTTYFTLPEDTAAWTGTDYLDQIVDWALNFVKGIPAVADIIPAQIDTLDEGADPFFKLNLILDSLLDLSFISGCGNDFFAFDIETMLMDMFLGNLLNFEIDEAVAILEENENSAIFNKQINLAVIDLVDDLLTGVFETNLNITAGDVDFSGDLASNDARAALRAAVGLDKLNILQIKAADVDGVEGLASGDARSILRAAVGLETL